MVQAHAGHEPHHYCRGGAAGSMNAGHRRPGGSARGSASRRIRRAVAMVLRHCSHAITRLCVVWAGIEAQRRASNAARLGAGRGAAGAARGGHTPDPPGGTPRPMPNFIPRSRSSFGWQNRPIKFFGRETHPDPAAKIDARGVNLPAGAQVGLAACGGQGRDTHRNP